MLTQLPTKLLYGLAKAGLHWATYYPHYKEKLKMKKFAYNPSLLQPTRKQISLLGASSHCIVKVITALHDVPEARKTRFAIYHLHYKDKFVDNPTRALVCATGYFYFLSKFENLSAASFLICNGRAAQPALVVKKGEPPRAFIYLLSHPLQFPSLFLS